MLSNGVLSRLDEALDDLAWLVIVQSEIESNISADGRGAVRCRNSESKLIVA
ncbi:hypothetical protein PIB30_085201, partial [Stylosanthes scabra]|nr:hypothetical protein [Stylosanthes scabra]